MVSVNPFAYVNALRAFVDQICVHLGAGEDVAVLAGPYNCDAIEDEVSDILGDAIDCTVLDSSRDLVSGDYRGLVLVRCLQESYAALCDRCKGLGLLFMLAPTGLTRSELGGYGLALTTRVKSETYRSAIIDLASYLCGGSPTFFESVVSSYATSEVNRQHIVNPVSMAYDVGRNHMYMLCEERSYYKDYVSGFLSWLFDASKGYFRSEADSQSTFLWAWSMGMCWRAEGIWHIDWSVLASASDTGKFGFAANEQLRPACDLLTEVAIRRIGIAETAAFMPVLERYCELSAARYACGTTRKNGLAESIWVPSRSDEIKAMRVFSKDNPGNWDDYVGRSVNMYEIQQLRNRLCHLNPFDVTPKMLEALKNAMLELSAVGREPYTVSSTCAFM